MGQARIFGQTAAGGSSGGSPLTVIAEEGSTITVAKDDKVLTSNETPAVFKRLEDGVWNATAEKEGTTPVSQNIELKTNYELKLMGKIYGISRDISASSPHWTRTHDAVGFNATASVGTVAGESDFDNIYPWSEMNRETLSTGDVMVKIPKFWFQRYREGNIEYINITDRAMQGFFLHPLFDRPDGVRDAAYVGAYKTTSNNRSVTGADPQRSQTRATMRTNARAKGTGWGLIDVAAVSAIQMLLLVEFATNDTQAAIGDGFTAVTSSALTGYCDNVPNLTGNPGGDTTKTDVVYRGIEGLWGNVWEFVDGINPNGVSYYVSNAHSTYADATTTGYTKLNYSNTAGTSYVKSLGVDTNELSCYMLPNEVNGSAATYYCDVTWASSSGWKVFLCGGGWSQGSDAGIFAANMSNASDFSGNGIGSRLLYLP